MLWEFIFCMYSQSQTYAGYMLGMCMLLHNVPTPIYKQEQGGGEW